MIMDLDATTRDAIASMCYARWSMAYDAHKKTKAATWESTGKFCPKAEWPQYYESMLAASANELALAEKLKTDICPFSPLVKGE